MPHLRIFPLALLLPAGLFAGSGDVLTTVKELTAALNGRKTGLAFDVTVRANCNSRPASALAVEDETDANFIETVDSHNKQRITEAIHCGDRLRITGHTQHCVYRYVKAYATNVVILARNPQPKPTDIEPRDFLDQSSHGRYLRLTGTLHDTFRDEIDSKTEVLILNCAGETICAFLIRNTDTSTDTFKKLIGARIAVSGVSNTAHYDGYRRFYGRYLAFQSPEDIEILSAPPQAPFHCPLLDEEFHLSAQEIAKLDRRRAVGHVLATWDSARFLLRTTNGNFVRVELAEPRLPQVGESVEAVGFPETDLFHLNLARADWQKADDTTVPADDHANETSLFDILHNNSNNPRINTTYHGQLIRLRGNVCNLQVSEGNRGSFILEDGNQTVQINASMVDGALSGLARGCGVSVTGVCVFNTEIWRPNAIIPHINGFQIVVREPGDIQILSYPPWWTTERLLTAIGTLLAVLAGILAWNVALRKVAARKGRELMREQLGHVKAELKTEERTRLAVELHDSLAQNLTGVSLEIDTAAKMADEDPSSMKTHLGVAARSLKSCRDELRNCLWDLRNRALETRTMNEAIRQTLAPHAVGVTITVRFNVPRERISDNTAHAILRIIRELTLNGIRHGGATKIWIAGSIEGDRMLFSVRDNGSGFDPETAPGFSEGHYGLLGIQERVDEFEGEFTLASAPGKGTKTTVSLKVPQET